MGLPGHPENRQLDSAGSRPPVVDAPAPEVRPVPPDGRPGTPILESPHGAVLLAPPGGPVPGADAVVPLPDGRRVAYAPRPVAPGEARMVEVDPFLRGNQFRPVLETDRTLGALLSLAAGRRLDTGPESARTFLILRGQGLFFTGDGNAHPFGPLDVAFVPAGEPAAVWSRGPEDVLAVVFQPKGPPAPRRTLLGEVRRRRQGEPDSSP